MIYDGFAVIYQMKRACGAVMSTLRAGYVLLP